MSTLVVWRLAPAERASAIFSGEGGLYASGRWHSTGHRVVYTAESRALAAMEILANIPKLSQVNRHHWVLAHAGLPEDLIEKPDRFPADWRSIPARESTRAFGDAWLVSARSPALRVPSAVIGGEFNYLLNPRHPAFAQIRLGPPEPFFFDPRLG